MKKPLLIATAVALVAVLGGGYYYFGVHQPYENAVAQFEAAKSDAESANKDLQVKVDEANGLLKAKATPFDQATFETLEATAAAAETVLVHIPALPDKTADILKSAEVLVAPVNSAAESTALNEAIEAYRGSVRQQEQITVPNESFVVERLTKVSSAMGVQAVTENNDPNGNLNKPGGYTASVYFTDSQVAAEVSGVDIVDRGVSGGGCVEVYPTVEDAEKRDAYLANFDGPGVFNPGSHKVYGTTVIRTSEHLTATQQKDLEKQILDRLIELK